MEKVIYEKPPVYVEYTSEEEIDSQIENQAFASIDSNQVEQPEDIVNERKEKDPYEHRRKVKHQKLRAQKRLTSAIWQPGVILIGSDGSQYRSPKARERQLSI